MSWQQIRLVAIMVYKFQAYQLLLKFFKLYGIFAIQYS